MKTISIVMASAALAFSVTAAAQDSDMIEVSSFVPTLTPYKDADGNTISVTPVLVRDNGDGTATVSPTEVTSFNGNPMDSEIGVFNGGPTFSINVSRPLGVSVALGWLVGTWQDTMDYEVDRLGLLIEGEVGTGGGKIGVGPMYEHMWMFFPVGVTAKAAILRTWGHTLGDIDAGETYAGAELNAIIFGARLGIGWYKRISADAGTNADDSFFMFSGGIGF